jgi:hypothetical protein
VGRDGTEKLMVKNSKRPYMYGYSMLLMIQEDRSSEKGQYCLFDKLLPGIKLKSPL